MKKSELNENQIVFYESIMKTLLTDEERHLGDVTYSGYYNPEPLSIKANILYVNDEGNIVMANDYFHNKDVKSFNADDGLSVGYMIDNWSNEDSVVYSEKLAPKNLEEKLLKVDIKTAGYKKETFENGIEELLNKVSESENYSDLALELGMRIAEYYITARSGETMDRKDYEHIWEDTIPLANEDETLRVLFPLRNGNTVTKISIVDSEDKGPRIELESENEKKLTMANLTKDGIQELTELLTEQAFYGPTIGN